MKLIKLNPQRQRQLEVRKRYFQIWQATGKRPFKKTNIHRDPIECSSCGTVFDSPYCPNCGLQYKAKNIKQFSRGAFDSIPFLNDDAKRTFLHLLVRPGYMIRDYISGHTSRYMAPLTSLIIFYAFFALISSVVAPNSVNDSVRKRYENLTAGMDLQLNMTVGADSTSLNTDKATKVLSSLQYKIATGYGLLHLDSLPELADTPAKASLAAFETALRSQGIPLFIMNLLLLTLTFRAVLRKKYRYGFSASASFAAYLLCQFCFFMLFTMLFTWGEKNSIGQFLMGVLMAWDFHQMLGLKWKKSIRLVIKSALVYYSYVLALSILAVTAISLFVWQ